MAMTVTKPQASVQIVMLEKQHDMQNERLITQMQTVLSAPPTPPPFGQGANLDKKA